MIVRIGFKSRQGCSAVKLAVKLEPERVNYLLLAVLTHDLSSAVIADPGRSLSTMVLSQLSVHLMGGAHYKQNLFLPLKSTEDHSYSLTDGRYSPICPSTVRKILTLCYIHHVTSIPILLHKISRVTIFSRNVVTKSSNII